MTLALKIDNSSIRLSPKENIDNVDIKFTWRERAIAEWNHIKKDASKGATYGAAYVAGVMLGVAIVIFGVAVGSLAATSVGGEAEIGVRAGFIATAVISGTVLKQEGLGFQAIIGGMGVIAAVAIDRIGPIGKIAGTVACGISLSVTCGFLKRRGLPYI